MPNAEYLRDCARSDVAAGGHTMGEFREKLPRFYVAVCSCCGRTVCVDGRTGTVTGKALTEDCHA